MFSVVDANFINYESLKNGKISEIFSEFNSLKKLKENDGLYFTGKISIFDYLIKSVKYLQGFVVKDSCFNQVEDKHTNLQLLIVASVFQFIGKPDALQFDKHGISFVKNYEIFSSELSASLLKRTTLTDREIQRVVNIVKNSTVFVKIIKSDNKNIEQDITNHKMFLGDIFKDLLYLFLANVEASELKNTNEKEYEFIKNYIDKLLK